MDITKTKKKLNVLFIAAEADPFIRVGGLGDVAYALPKALMELSNNDSLNVKLDIRVAIPCHAKVTEKVKNAQVVASFSIPHSGEEIPVKVFHTLINGLSFYFFSGDPIIPCDSPVYSGNNRIDAIKYFFFSLASLEFTRKIDWKPDILHANDWHTSLAVYQLNELRKSDPFFQGCHSIITLHNLPYMGTGTENELYEFGVKPAVSEGLPEWARYLPLPLGLYSADQIVAVSPTYGQEILTPDFGCGLDQYLLSRQSTVTGIINGIDQNLWNPATDKSLPVNFSSNNLEMRNENKNALIQEFDLVKDDRIPLITLIGRLDPQKGVDIALEALRQLSDLPWQAIILGTGFSKIEEDTQKLADEFPTQVRTALRFDGCLSRRLYGGADMILMPSRYEPCGLAQMIAMRYGCVPVARATGGLRDTITDISNIENATGFLFENPIGSNMAGVMTKALSTFEDKTTWKELQLRGMMKDYSWQVPAQSYADLYEKLSQK